jgi:hypothetical protein
MMGFESFDFNERYDFLGAYYWDKHNKNLVFMTMELVTDEVKLPEDVKKWLKEQITAPSGDTIS